MRKRGFISPALLAVARFLFMDHCYTAWNLVSQFSDWEKKRVLVFTVDYAMM